jgi:hypothetical protein
MCGRVCGAIFQAAGPAELQAACNQVAPIKTGEAAITPGFQLPAKYVIHAAGPVYDHRHKAQSEAYLRSAYTESLKLATEHNCQSIDFVLALALELTLDETDDLLERVGYALSHASKFDVIVEFFIVKGNYNIFEINKVLFQYDQPLFGG